MPACSHYEEAPSRAARLGLLDDRDVTFMTVAVLSHRRMINTASCLAQVSIAKFRHRIPDQRWNNPLTICLAHPGHLLHIHWPSKQHPQPVADVRINLVGIFSGPWCGSRGTDPFDDFNKAIHHLISSTSDGERRTDRVGLSRKSPSSR